MNDYDYISDIYDIYNSADYDINYFINRYNNFSGQAIELMAGSGRLSIPLLKEGIKLDCLDISNGLLNELRKKLKKEYLSSKLFKEDVCDFHFLSRNLRTVWPNKKYLQETE